MIPKRSAAILAFFAISAAFAGINPEKITVAENVMWSRFFIPKTNLFYECLTSYNPETCQSHLPTADEVKRQYPNPCGYATGMEDCAILGGVVLAALADEFDATKNPATADRAKLVLNGLDSLVLPDGFVARGICPEDGKSVYINSSVDQYTHCIHGMWRYYKSPMCDAADKAKIKGALLRIAARLRRNVTSKNDFDSLRLDGKPCALRISRFTCESPHVAARLAMAYAAAWNVSGDAEYFGLYRSLIEESVSVSEQIKVNSRTPVYSFLQMQASLEVLFALEKDENIKSRIGRIMDKIPALCLKFVPAIERRFDNADTEMLYGDWRRPEKWENRNGYMIPKLGKTRNVWRTIRETGEIALVAAMAPHTQTPSAIASLFEKSAAKIDYKKCASCGVIFHYAAYWADAKRRAAKRQQDGG